MRRRRFTPSRVLLFALIALSISAFASIFLDLIPGSDRFDSSELSPWDMSVERWNREITVEPGEGPGGGEPVAHYVVLGTVTMPEDEPGKGIELRLPELYSITGASDLFGDGRAYDWEVQVGDVRAEIGGVEVEAAFDGFWPSISFAAEEFLVGEYDIRVEYTVNNPVITGDDGQQHLFLMTDAFDPVFDPETADASAFTTTVRIDPQVAEMLSAEPACLSPSSDGCSADRDGDSWHIRTGADDGYTLETYALSFEYGRDGGPGLLPQLLHLLKHPNAVPVLMLAGVVLLNLLAFALAQIYRPPRPPSRRSEAERERALADAAELSPTQAEVLGAEIGRNSAILAEIIELESLGAVTVAQHGDECLVRETGDLQRCSKSQREFVRIVLFPGGAREASVREQVLAPLYHRFAVGELRRLRRRGMVRNTHREFRRCIELLAMFSGPLWFVLSFNFMMESELYPMLGGVGMAVSILGANATAFSSGSEMFRGSTGYVPTVRGLAAAEAYSEGKDELSEISTRFRELRGAFLGQPEASRREGLVRAMPTWRGDPVGPAELEAYEAAIKQGETPITYREWRAGEGR